MHRPALSTCWTTVISSEVPGSRTWRYSAAAARGGRIQELGWNGEVLWDFEFASDEHLLHHDVAVLPNGNILAIAWERRSALDALQAGRRPEMIPEDGVWPDMVIELEPQPPDDARIIWQWHAWDHLIQDRDESENGGAKIDHRIGGMKPPAGGGKPDRSSGPPSIPRVFCGTREGCIEWSSMRMCGVVSMWKG